MYECVGVCEVLCEGVTYDNWPWGKQHCNLNFGSWTFDADQYDLQFYNNKVLEVFSNLLFVSSALQMGNCCEKATKTDK